MGLDKFELKTRKIDKVLDAVLFFELSAKQREVARATYAAGRECDQWRVLTGGKRP